MNNHNNPIQYANDDYESVGTLIKLRSPSLILGLLLGIGLSFATSNFEEVLAHNVRVAFFLPFVVYIAAAIGTQTESIYARDLRSGRAKFSNYLKKEIALGIILGLTFGIVAGGISYVWFSDDLLALSVAISTLLAITVAPIVAIFVTHFFQSIKRDPAANSGPIATVLQDITSVIIYGLVCSAILL